MLISRRVARAIAGCKDSATLADMSFYSSKDFSSVLGGGSTKDIAISPDGTKGLLVEYGTSLHGLTLSTPHNISSASLTSSKTSGLSNIIHLAINDDGTKGCYIDNTADMLRCFSLSVGWDPTSTFTARNTRTLAADVYRGVDFNDVGTRIYYFQRGPSVLYQYNCSDWNVGTYSFGASADFTSLVGDGQGHFGGWNRDGTRFLLTDIGNRYVYERIASSAWNVGSSTAGASFNAASYVDATAQLQAHWGPCGNIYICDDANDNIIQLRA